LLGEDLTSAEEGARRSIGYLLIMVLLLAMALAGISRAFAVEETEVESDTKPHMVLVPRVRIGLEYGAWWCAGVIFPPPSATTI
jgi:hypothetical protein